MRITHVVRQFHPAIGGMEDFVMQLALRQQAAGHAVRVVTLNRVFDAPETETLARRDEVNGIEIRRVPFMGSKRYPIAPAVLGQLGDADIVHVHGVDFLFDFLSLTRFLHRRTLVLSTHGGFFHTNAQARLKTIYFNTVTRCLIRNYRAVFPSSVFDRESFSRIRKTSMKTIENGVDIDKFAGLAAANGKTLIYFGRLAPNKRIDRLIAWFAALNRADSEWRLLIAGKPMGVSLAELDSQCEALAIAGFVEFYATPSDDELRSLVARSSVYVCASDYEGFGLAAVEAIAAGLFPVLSDIPAFRRTLERVGFGMISRFEPSPDDARRLSEALAGWQPPPDLLASLESLFGWKGVASAFHAGYLEALAPEPTLS